MNFVTRIEPTRVPFETSQFECVKTGFLFKYRNGNIHLTSNQSYATNFNWRWKDGFQSHRSKSLKRKTIGCQLEGKCTIYEIDSNDKQLAFHWRSKWFPGNPLKAPNCFHSGSVLSLQNCSLPTECNSVSSSCVSQRLLLPFQPIPGFWTH